MHKVAAVWPTQPLARGRGEGRVQQNLDDPLWNFIFF